MATSYQTLKFENIQGFSVELWEYEFSPWLFFKIGGEILDRLPVRQEFVSIFEEMNNKILDYEKLERHCELLEDELQMMSHENDDLRVELYALKESVESTTIEDMQRTIENQNYMIHQYEQRIDELKNRIQN